MLMAMAIVLDIELEQLMLKMVFNMITLIKEIYMANPKVLFQKNNENVVCRLTKSLYGLKQSPKFWYKQFNYSF